ncbi:hypothetical protein [Phorcysia thermohydrogeniphila]|uniref:Uncharacterized protein n=1 Tax=Phorcysia thermohydrogeniphila TaxID=936138 RepID=A0A4R1GEL7_9BACT|nr:hypothetical protein [Phorcysia thermohydrogeniphila]TCK06418.1 hypothetical protein CLV27_0219 [Phorcysia thermohydrogeniphila]
MDDSFSILSLTAEEPCEEAKERGKEVEVKHFVFEDLLDTQEKLVCNCLAVNELFSVYHYLLRKDLRSLFSRKEELSLGCYLAYRGGSLFTFEDFNFKIHSLEEFSLLVEAVEVSSGSSFYFELCNLCELPERTPHEQDVILTLYATSLKRLPPSVHFDQIADENREILKLAVRGNEKATEKLERELGERETERLLAEFRTRPEELFDTCILSTQNLYSIIGIVTSVRKVSVLGKSLYSVGLFSEEVNLTVLAPTSVRVTDGDRIEVSGRMYGVAVF